MLNKVALIIGLAEACGKAELCNLLLEKVKDEEQVFHIQIPDTKTKISREFFVTSGGIEGLNMVQIVRQYWQLRPRHTIHARFFVGYRNGACTRLPVGINTFAMVPKNVGLFLKLPDPAQYTCHCFRRSSTSWLADSGADLLTIKRHGGWKSNTVAEGYIDSSIENKKKVAANILGELELEPSISLSNSCNDYALKVTTKPGIGSSGVNVSNCKNCTINIYTK